MRKTFLFLGSAIVLGFVFGRCSPDSRDTTVRFRVQQNGKIGYIDPAGKMVIPAMYHNASDFSEGIAAVRPDGRYGYIDTRGRVVISPRFDWAAPFSDSLALVNQDGIFFYIRHDGRPAFACHYRTLSSFHHGVAVVETFGGHRGLIDRQGLLILDTAYSAIDDFDEGLAWVELASDDIRARQGLIDTLGRFVVPIGKYNEVGKPHKGYSLCSDSSENQFFVNRAGHVLFQQPKTAGEILDDNDFADGIIRIRWNRGRPPHEGFLDTSGHILLDSTAVQYVTGFSGGRGFAGFWGQYGYQLIDTYGKRVGVDNYEFKPPLRFINGHAIAGMADGFIIIDTNGRIVYEPPDVPGLHVLRNLGEGYFLEEWVLHLRPVLYGVGTLTGKLIYPTQLDEVDRSGFSQGLLRVMIRNTRAVIDTTGKIIWRDRVRLFQIIRPLNADYMLPAHFFADSTPGTNRRYTRSGWGGLSPDTPRQIQREPFVTGKLQLVIDTNRITTLYRQRDKVVYLANKTDDTVHFKTSMGCLHLITQAQEGNGPWRDIDYLSDDLHFRNYSLALPPNAFWRFTLPVFEGSIPVRIRLQLECIDPQHPDIPRLIYSNIIRGSINPGQYWNKRPDFRQGMIDEDLE